MERQMDKINLGIVGLRFGSTMIEQLMQGEGSRFFRVHSVYDLDQAKTGVCAANYGAKPHDSLDSLLADPDVQAIGLFTPPAGRAELIGRIIGSGKDVMTTKPFEMDPCKARNILEKANELKRVVHLNSPGPLKDNKLRQIEAWRERFDLGIPVGCRADIWVNYREQADGGWYDDPEKCPVAPIFRLGIYIINDMVRLFGPARQVAVMSSRLLTGRPTVDNAQVSIQFRNGAIAGIFGSFCVDDSQRYKEPMTINFERGTIYSSVMPQEEGEPGKLLLVTKDRATGERVTEETYVTGGSGEYQWEEWHGSIIERRLNDEAYIRDIVEGINIIEAMRKSDKTGATQKVGENV
ncbi:Gfo/Idh/MocA family protein [Paenibacillus thalictri]|uniref:Gfo/Idh/MocA family oxidoreductase n=1 Tax=Paenibacillus thalictri TaxID=2527873 RepID=A0A4Q9DKW2_9BACL|nr:Gfo/Idh/MocA family oxidoreductase [Paenibacillus thalictri]TBL72417.1 Gfo/Idh/MocA family oxidoreductase [Paenibacillus thalictri]